MSVWDYHRLTGTGLGGTGVRYEQAAVVVVDHAPDEEELAELAYSSLEDFEAEDAVASIDVTDHAPAWLTTCEQDQVNAHLRDGRPNARCVIVYMRSGELGDDDPEDAFEVTAADWEDDEADPDY